MQQPPVVGGRQSQGDLATQVQHRRDCEAPGPAEQRFQAYAPQPLHAQKRDAILFTDVVDGDDVLVFKRRRRPGLAQESCPRPGIGG